MRHTKEKSGKWWGTQLVVFVTSLIAGALLCGRADALSIQVVGSDGAAVGSYYWVVEEDATHEVVPGVIEDIPLSVRFHTSYMPVVAGGDNATPPTNLVLDPTKRYYVSVLPKDGYTIGGASLPAGRSSVRIVVNKLPLPTAQIAVLVFEDNMPINNTPDLPAERGLAGFSVTLVDAGGRYGISGGQMMADTFGNPLGTEYDMDGNVVMMGDGFLLTDADGKALFKNLAPGKYTIFVKPPAGEGWSQTTTIEGTKGVDVWVKSGEPAYLQEFGPVLPHVFMGFVRSFNSIPAPPPGQSAADVSGRIVTMRLASPDQTVFSPGAPFDYTTPWIGLNEIGGNGVYVAKANDDGTFVIPQIPPGLWQLVVWDENNDIIIHFATITVPDGGGVVNIGDVPVFPWFTGMRYYVFEDDDADGFRDPGEVGIPNITINHRFRDGTVYQTSTTDLDGYLPFDEIFPFFNFLVSEVDFARFKATGFTVVVDNGGDVLLPSDCSAFQDVFPGGDCTFGGFLFPQNQPDNGGLPFRTEHDATGMEGSAYLLQSFIGNIGQYNVIEWGKKAYEMGENGGITGVVYYDTTRAENDPAFNAPEPWQPGIPRVPINLYQDSDADGVIDDVNGDGHLTLADADQHPFGNFPGPEDTDHNLNDRQDFGDAIASVTTDSWDDNLPTGCVGADFDSHGNPIDCFDSMWIFNQVRGGVFDGGYGFTSYVPGGIDSGNSEVLGIPGGTYIVEAVLPRGYELVKEEDKNVDFGDTFSPAPMLFPPSCVGDLHVVPAELDLFPGVPGAFAGQSRPLCNRKQVILNDSQNSAADFYAFTKAPVSGHIIGLCLDDLSNEFDPNSPNFGEKYAPPFLPIAVKDWTGREIARTYTDEWGKYNLLVPSTYTINTPSPSGVSANMLMMSMNDPGPIPDPSGSGNMIDDPFFNPHYIQVAYTLQFMPGATTYLDTPVFPAVAYPAQDQFPADCDPIDGTPIIYSVEAAGSGPYAATTGGLVTIKSIGSVFVENPLYDGPGGTHPQKTVQRDHGFGNMRGSVAIGGVPLENVTWSNGTIRGKIAAGTVTGQVSVTRADTLRSTIAGVTFTIGGPAPRIVQPGGSIQAAIDAASAGDLILVKPGIYRELVVMWKPVRLQGYGEGSTRINGAKSPPEKVQAWRDKVEALVAAASVDLLPGQAIPPGGIDGISPFNGEGPVITVLAKEGAFGVGGVSNARIDGFYITGGDFASGIFINGYAHYLEISNNRLSFNMGTFGGGIRSGNPTLLDAGEYVLAGNDHLKISHNRITQNRGVDQAGGGIALFAGSDNYEISDSFICGNFSSGSGGAIGHLGLSDNGLIKNNQIVFNQSFDQGTIQSGGGIFVGGQTPIAPATLTLGSGSVKIVNNLIQGNQAGAGDGGGIRLANVNGQDVLASPDDMTPWYGVEILNNMIVNNLTGLAGGGVSLQDAAKVSIIHNTVAMNDSTATAGEAFAGGLFDPANLNESLPWPAGIVARDHTAALAAAIGAVDPLFASFSNPHLENNIIWKNRSFRFVNQVAGFKLLPDISAGDPPVYDDLKVLGTGTADVMRPLNCILTDAAGYDASNLSADPMFMFEYVNGARNSILKMSLASAIEVQPAFDEGGNFIDARFGPLTLTGDYHIETGSPAVDSGNVVYDSLFAELDFDFDGQTRPKDATEVDIGTDEQYPPNIQPIARYDSESTRRNVSKAINILANDTDADGSIPPDSVTIVSQPRFGSVAVNTITGVVTYTPKRNFVGIDYFYYTVWDNLLATSNQARVSVRVIR